MYLENTSTYLLLLQQMNLKANSCGEKAGQRALLGCTSRTPRQMQEDSPRGHQDWEPSILPDCGDQLSPCVRIWCCCEQQQNYTEASSCGHPVISQEGCVCVCVGGNGDDDDNSLYTQGINCFCSMSNLVCTCLCTMLCLWYFLIM